MFGLGAVLLLAFVFLSGNASGETQVDSEVRYKPEDCTLTTQKGDILAVHYTGMLVGGEVFDSSVDQGEPFVFTLGAGQVIPGWDVGLQGLCAGEKRRLTIPSNLAYGDEGAGGVIPPGATLVFDVEIMGINDPAYAQDRSSDGDGNEAWEDDEAGEGHQDGFDGEDEDGEHDEEEEGEHDGEGEDWEGDDGEGEDDGEEDGEAYADSFENEEL